MRRISKRMGFEDQPVIQFKYIETPGQSEIQYIEVEKEVIREIETDPIIIQQEAAQVDLEPIYDKLFDLESKLMVAVDVNKNFRDKASMELEMQRRALVSLKAQRDIDRSRRLMFINRVKKENKARQAAELKLKLAIVASLMISIISLFVKF